VRVPDALGIEVFSSVNAVAALSVLIGNVTSCDEHLVVCFEEACPLIFVDVALLACAKHSEVLGGTRDFFAEKFEYNASFFVVVRVFELVSNSNILEALDILLGELRKLAVVAWFSFSLIFVVALFEEAAEARFEFRFGIIMLLLDRFVQGSDLLVFRVSSDGLFDVSVSFIPLLGLLVGDRPEPESLRCGLVESDDVRRLSDRGTPLLGLVCAERHVLENCRSQGFRLDEDCIRAGLNVLQCFLVVFDG